MRPTSPLVFTLCALAASAAFADAGEQATTLDTVIVTATRNPIPAKDVLAAVTVISREEIERAQASDLAQLLQMHAGLDIGRSGGPGQPASVFIRGGNSDHTLVLIDGVRVNPATSGAALALIAPEMIERIEIVKGPRSTLYGSDALAGVINIITRSSARLATAAALRIGSYKTREASASHSFGDQHANFSIHAGETRADGFPTFRGATQNRGYRLSSFNLRGAADLWGLASLKAQVWRAEGSNQYLNQNLDFPPPDFNAVLTGYTPLAHDTLNQTAAVSLETSPLKNLQTRLSLAHSTDDLREQQSSSRVRTQRPELRLDNTFTTAGQRLSFGINAAQDRVDVFGGSAISDVRTLGAAYAQAELGLGRHHAVLGLARTRYEGFASATTYNAEYGLDVWTGARLIAAYGTGFHAPDANDRFSAFGGDPNLKPERSRSGELGLQQSFGAHRLDLRAFRNEVRDLIVFRFDFNQPDFGDNVNLDRARTEGIELAYTGRYGPLEARLEGVVQSAKDCSNDDLGNKVGRCEEGSRLKRRNDRSLSGALTWHFTRGSLGIDAYGAQDRRDFEGLPPFRSDVKDAGYGLINASASYDLGQGFRLSLRGENLLDADYQTANGYQQAGASGYATLRYDWAAP